MEENEPKEAFDSEPADISKELARRRESGELEPIDYEVSYISYLQEMGEPVTSKDVGNRAIVIKPEEFEVLGYIEMVNQNGQIVVIDFEDEGFDKSKPFIVFPEELGERKTNLK